MVDTSIKFIFHLADIHIGSGSNRSTEYRKVFDILRDKIASFPYKTNLAVVIVGDIFHHKNKYSGEDVDTFCYLMKCLAFPGVRIIIVPGNHDVNLANPNSVDLVSPLLADGWKTQITYIRDTSVVDLGGIKFLHVSVFDKSQAPIIEAYIRDNPHPRMILLYHGMVNGAKFNTHTASGTRITTDIMNSTYLTLLGDIHEHQFVTPTAAYSGSLIQQNVGESSNKGFILWDIEKRSSKFIYVENPTGFLKLDLRGKSIEECDRIVKTVKAPTEILRLSVITDAEDDVATAQTNLIKSKFGRVDHVNKVVGGGVNRITVDPVKDQIEALRELLVSVKATPEDAAKIIEMHQSSMVTYDCRKWYIKSVRFDNMFKYGEGNFIDFTSASGISGVVADNRAGKSSIIDVCVFGLFGDLLRGSKSSMVRWGKTSAYVRVDFVVNGADYYVERVDKPPHAKVTLMEIKDGKPVDITEKSVDETYRKIRTLVGTVDQLHATGLYYDAIKDITRMNKTERMKVLPELFGLLDNDVVLRQLSTRQKEVKQKLVGLVKPRVDNLVTAYEAKSAEAKELLTRKATLLEQHQTTSQRLNDMYKYHGQKYDPIKLRQLETRKKTLDEELVVIGGELAQTMVEIKQEVLYAEPVPGLTAETNIAKIVAAIEEEIESDMPNVEELATRCAVLESQLGNSPCDGNVATLMTKSNTLSKHLVVLADSATEPPNEDEIGELNQKLKDFRLLDSKKTQIDILKARESQLAIATELKFNDACECCRSNMELLSNSDAELAAVRKELARLIKEEAKVAKKNSKLESSRQSWQRRLDHLVAAKQHHNKMKELNEELEATNNRIKMLKTREELDHCTKLLSTAKKSHIAEQRLYKVYQYSQYLKCKKRNDLTMLLSIKKAEVEKLSEEIVSISKVGTAAEEIEKLLLVQNQLSKDISNVDVRIGAITNEMVFLEREIEISAVYNREFPTLTEELRRLKLYHDCLGSKGLRMQVIKRNISKIIASTNEILKLITDFTLNCEITDTHMDLFFDEQVVNDVAIKLPVDNASGFQKFIISLAFRLALTSALYSSPEFLIIDEGFGCMDKSNLSRLADVFLAIRDSYKFIFVISHVDELQSVINHPITISQREFLDRHNNRLKCSWVNTLGGTLAAAPVVEPKKTKAKKDPAEMVMCECGKSVKRGSLAAHKKTKKHLMGPTTNLNK